ELIKLVTLIATTVTLALTVWLVAAPFDIQVGSMQQVFSWRWIPSFDIDYFMGVDGISLPLLVLTAFITFLSMIASWTITKNVKAYCMLFLVLETGMLGVF